MRYDPPERAPKPVRQVDPVFIWPTPEESDRLFWVEKDMKLPKDREFTYGQAYWDAVTYPDHKLVYVSPQNEDNISRWFYAKDRTDEDNYNFQYSSANIGGRKFDTVQRTYMVPRATWSETSPAVGAAMPTDPSTKFASDYVLADREQRRTETEIDAIYVFEARTYVRKVTVSTLRLEDGTGGMRRLKETLYYRGETISGTPVETLFGDEANAYWDLQGSGVTRNGQQLSEDWFSVTETAYDAEDALTGERVSLWGVLTTTKEVVADGTAASHAEGVASSEVDARGDGNSVKTVASYPTADGSGVIATLEDQDEDPQVGIITDIEKILVVNSQKDAVAVTKRTAGWQVEQKGQDQNHTVLIASKVDASSLPSDEVFWDNDTVRLPDVLTSLEIIWNEQQGGGNSSSFDEGGKGFSSSARGSASASLSASIAIGVDAGFSGRTKAKVTRSYQVGPPGDLITPYNIVPVYGTIALDTGAKRASASVSKTITDSRRGTTIGTQQTVSSNSRVIRIGPFLSGGVTPTGDRVHILRTPTYYGLNQGSFAYADVQVTGKATIELGVSTPTTIISGQVVSRYQVAKRWRLGIWIIETIEVYAP